MMARIRSRRNTILSIVLVIAVIISTSYYIIIQNNREGINKNSYQNITGSSRYSNITLNEYEELIDSAVKFLGRRKRLFEPWIVPNGSSINFGKMSGYIQVNVLEAEIEHTEEKLNETINDIIGKCGGTLWEIYVKYVASYWLGVGYALDKAKEYLHGVQYNINGRIITIRKDPRTAYGYLIISRYLLSLLPELNNSTIKKNMCSISIDQFKKYALNLYTKFKQVLYERRKVVLDKINLERLKASKYRFIYEIFARKIYKELESGKGPYSNETIFQDYLNKLPMAAFESMINVFIIINEYMDVFLNASIVEKLETITTNKSYIENRFQVLKTIIMKLYNRSQGNILKLLVAHIITRRIFNLITGIRDYLEESFSTKTVINESNMLGLFIDDPNVALRFIDFLFASRPINLVIKVLEESTI